MKLLCGVMVGLTWLAGCGPTVRVSDGFTGRLWFVDGVQQDGATPDDDARELVARLPDIVGYFRSLMTQPELDRLASFRNADVTMNHWQLRPDGQICRNQFNASATLRPPNEAIVNVCDNSVGTDVLGHELTHALVSFFVAQGDRALKAVLFPNSGESGAIEEALGDFFGERAEQRLLAAGGLPPNWIVGGRMPALAARCSPSPPATACAAGDTCDNDAANRGRNICVSEIGLNEAYPGADGALRNMADPRALSAPDYYQGNDWDAAGEVHQNANVFDKVLWLLAEGTSHTHRGLTIQPVADIDRIVMSVVRLGPMLFSFAGTYDRLASIMPLFAGDPADARSIRDAFCAVGLPSTDPECDDRETAGCAAGVIGDGLVGRVDNCPALCSADTKDDDGDGAGNVCDADRDGDGVPDVGDNCPTVYNPDQRDLPDADGHGDRCDPDWDEDTIVNDLDNCPIDANTDQKDDDVDGRGNVCDTDRDGDCIPDAVDHCPDDAVCNPPPPALCRSCILDVGQLEGAIEHHFQECIGRGGTICMDDGCPGGGPLGGALVALPEATRVRFGIVNGPGGKVVVTRPLPSFGGPRGGLGGLGGGLGGSGINPCLGLEAQIRHLGAQLSNATILCERAKAAAEQGCNPTTCPP